MADAIAGAKEFVLMHPARSSTPEARIFYHAVMDYFRELGISSEDRKKIIELWVEAECSTWRKGWSEGWNKAIDAYSPPF